MKVSELCTKYKLFLSNAKDRELVKQYGESNVLAYVVCYDDKMLTRQHAYLFKTQRLVVGIVNRVRVKPSIALGVIRTMRMDSLDLTDKEAERYIVAETI